MKRLLIKLLMKVDRVLLWVEATTRWIRTKIQWMRWDLEDTIDWRGSNEVE